MTLSHTKKTVMVGLIGILSMAAALMGIIGTWVLDGTTESFVTVRGDTVTLFGRGVYAHMSHMVALQGAAQDLVTLFLGVPALILTAHRLQDATFKRLVLHAGVVAYFAVTYTIYLFMATYSAAFLIYAALAGLSVNLLVRLLAEGLAFPLQKPTVQAPFAKRNARRLMVIAVVMALLWLMSIVPPLTDGTLYPSILEHYTTLVVQGIDLAWLLPWAFMSGLWLLSGRDAGFLFTHVYLVFLVLLMAALSAKVIAVGIAGEPVLPAIAVLPLFMTLALLAVVRFLRFTPGQ